MVLALIVEHIIYVCLCFLFLFSFCFYFVNILFLGRLGVGQLSNCLGRETRSCVVYMCVLLCILVKGYGREALCLRSIDLHVFLIFICFYY